MDPHAVEGGNNVANAGQVCVGNALGRLQAKLAYLEVKVFLSEADDNAGITLGGELPAFLENGCWAH